MLSSSARQLHFDVLGLRLAAQRWREGGGRLLLPCTAGWITAVLFALLAEHMSNM